MSTTAKEATGATLAQKIYPPRGRAIFVCVILSLGYMLAFTDRTVVALLVIPIEHDLSLTDMQIGLLQGTAFAVFYALFGLPIAWAVDRLDRRLIVAFGVLIWSAMTCIGGLSTSFLQFFLARVGVGVGEATILPGATSMLADYFPPASRGRALGAFASGIYFGSALALIGGGLILHRLAGRMTNLAGLGAFHPWQIVMIAAGLPGLLLALVALWMHEPPRRHRMTAAAPEHGGLIASLRRPGRALIAHIVGFTAVAFASYAATAWLPTIFIRTHGWTEGQIGLRLGLTALLLGPLGSMTGGTLADRLERLGRRDGKFLVGAIAAIGTVPPALVLGLAGNAALAFAAAAMVIFFTSFVWGLAPAALQDIIHGASLGRVTAIYTAALNLIALGLGPVSVPLVAALLHERSGNITPAIAVVVPAAALVAAASFIAGRGAFEKARDRLHQTTTGTRTPMIEEIA